MALHPIRRAAPAYRGRQDATESLHDDHLGSTHVVTDDTGDIVLEVSASQLYGDDMTVEAERILRAALELPAREREELVERLEQNLGASSGP